MHILIFEKSIIPVINYGGIARVIWALGKALNHLGHKVTYLVNKGSTCDFGNVISYNPELPINKQIPIDVDLIHMHRPINELFSKPVIYTNHVNYRPYYHYHKNTVFVSQSHSNRYGSSVYVHNGLDIDEYNDYQDNRKRKDLLFIGRTNDPKKNVLGAIKIAKRLNRKLKIIGGKKLLYNWRRINYLGLVGGHKKNFHLNSAEAFLFPVKFNEPFGLVILEAMLFGNPIIGSRYGALSEIIPNEFGLLTNDFKNIELIYPDFINDFNRKTCREYVCDKFNSTQMAKKYLKFYELVLNGKNLNSKKPYCNNHFEIEEQPIND